MASGDLNILAESTKAPDAICVSDIDHVAVALKDLAAGQQSSIAPQLALRADIPKGHKFALRNIAAGNEILKYGWPIGVATEDIQAGDWVHVHNVKTSLGGEQTYSYQPKHPPVRRSGGLDTFLGYKRPDGRVGVRNEIWIIATVGCVANVCDAVAMQARLELKGRIDGVLSISHPFGCSQLGDDLSNTRTILAALAQHPNAGGVVVVGLGCENNQMSELLKAAPNLDPNRVRTVRAQSVDDERLATLEAIYELANIIEKDERTECASSELVIGVKCGGSDGLSGLTANPLVGAMTDRVTQDGGAAILTEIPEIFGAEHLLMRHCENEGVFNDLVQVVNDFKRYFLDLNQPVYENPSPGNKEGGVTTLEEKSLGAVQKAGQAQVTSVIRYGGRVKAKGLTVLEAPGNDAVSSTALAAAGATIILFTTGRGTPLGFPAPTIKISSNSDLAQRKTSWIDFNAGRIVEGEARADVEDSLWRHILDVANGKLTRAEERQERSVALWKQGVTL